MSTIKDVAARARVSIKTVSSVINHEPGVSEGTRRNVEAAIRDLDYAPNVSAQRLKRGRSELLALVLPLVQSPYATKLFANILAESHRHHYSLVVLDPHAPGTPSSELEQIVRNHRIDGAILAPPGADYARLIAFLKKNHVLYAAIAPNNPDEHYFTVDITDRAGGFEAAQYLIDLGHTRIAHITCLSTEYFSQERLTGYREAMEQAGLPMMICEGSNTIESGFAAAMSLFQQDTPPTAIFAGNDEMAVGTILAALHMGRHVPGDLSVIGFDDILISQQIRPRLTTIVQPIQEVARMVIETLLGLIECNTGEVNHIVIPTRLVVRDSCVAPKLK
jgi:LacI family transcriptional regulator